MRAFLRSSASSAEKAVRFLEGEADMAEEHRCQVPPEGPRLCANNCGFFGCPAMLGLCSKCYSDYRLKQDQEASAKMAVEKSLLGSVIPADLAASSDTAAEQSPSIANAYAAGPVALPTQELRSPEPLPEPTAPTAAPSASPAVKPGRCTSCRKRVGLTGFRCRCGQTFCGSHRYPEEHGCSFDFKAAGRVEIARANPIVKAEKVQKI